MMQKHSVKQQILFDAETQCEKVLERSIAIQALAPRKKNTKKSKKSDSAYNSNSNISCPVATPLTPVEIVLFIMIALSKPHLYHEL